MSIFKILLYKLRLVQLVWVKKNYSCDFSLFLCIKRKDPFGGFYIKVNNGDLLELRDGGTTSNQYFVWKDYCSNELQKPTKN